jgi:catechol 2,3-dioxygenase-like lactoylglutathione lyase family enzyme
MTVTVRYLVHDVETAVAFYRDALGFEVRQRFGPAMAALVQGELNLWLAGPAASAAKALPDGRVPVPGGWNRFVLETPDLEALVAKLRRRGVRFRNDIVMGPGGAQILVEDPSGNPIELFQPR